MADYGLNINDAQGNARLSVDDKITRLRYTTTATAGDDDSVVLSDIAGLRTVQFGIAADTTIEDMIPHKVTRSGTTISWEAKSSGGISSGDTIIFVFLYS